MLKNFIFLILLTSSFETYSQQLDYTSKTLLDGLNQPWGMDFISEDKLLITEKVGKLKLLNFSSGEVKDIKGLPKIHFRSQGGLSEIKVSPNFKEDKTIFFSYTSLNSFDGTNTLAVSSASLNGEKLENVKEIFRAKANRRTGAHYGAKILFLSDGTLLISSGDGFDHREQAQFLDNHFGKLIRINKDGSIPDDNPFIKDNRALDDIFSYGHRNPQGLIQLNDGQIIEHEHGPFGGDEINIIQSGKNYGWPAITYGRDYSGAIISPFTEMDGMEQPIKYWVPSIAPSGMIYYTGDNFPEWKNSLMISSLKAKKVSKISFNETLNSSEDNLFQELNHRFRNILQHPNGNILLLTDGPRGKLIEISPLKNLEIVTPDGITAFYLRSPESLQVPAKPYDTSADADALLARAINSLEPNKKLLLVLGGNWCPDCRVLAGMLKSSEVKEVINKNYIVQHIDVGRFDKNLHIPKKFGIEKLYGVPTVLVIDQDKQVLNSPFIDDWTTARTKKPEDLTDYLSRWIEG